MRRYFLIALSALAFLPALASASVSAAPAVMNLRGEARDILKETVTVTNASGRKVSVYPVVNNIAVREGRQEFLDPSRADLADSLANWIFFPRGALELEPGESRTIEFEVRVNLTAKTGMHHASIAFPEGSNRADAESKAASAPAVFMNLEVEEKIVENLVLRRFAPERSFFPGFPASFAYEMENTGNRAEVPQGEILIYDPSGKELGAVAANRSGEALAPGDRKEFTGAWQGQGMGRYKAVLSLSYGEGGAARLQDTVFFWVIPWPRIVFLALALFAAVFAGAAYIHRRYERWHLANAVPRRAGGDARVVDLRHPPRHD